jgi:hypothetical protein
VLFTRGEFNFGHSGHSLREIVHPKHRKVPSPAFQKNEERQRPN